MAEETPENINPATDPQVEDAPSTAVPLAEIDTAPAPVAPATNPEVPSIPVPRIEIPPPPPDAAFRAEQAQQENRWIQAAAANPENININGSVTVDLGDGRKETINRDGSYEISGGDGTFRFDAAGQQTSYTTPPINGVSVTSTTDGVQYTNISQGPLTKSIITKDGEPISTTTSFTIDTAAGPLTLTETNITGGEIIRTAEQQISVDTSDQDIIRAQTLTLVQVGEGEIITTEGTLPTKTAFREAYLEANAENIKLREELIAAKQQTAAGIPLSDTQIAALEEQAQATAAADADLVAAEQALAEVDPTVVATGEDPQVDTFVDAVTDPLPSLDTVEVAPENVDPDTDPEVAGVAVEEVPLAEIDTGPAPLTDAEIAEYRARTATQVNETGAKFQEPFVSDEAAAAEAAYFKENPEAVRAVIDAPPPPTVESEIEELDLTLEEAEERVAAFEDNTELTTEEEAADPDITAVESGIPLGEIDSEPLTVSQDDPQAFREGEFSLSAADIDSGDDLDQDPGPGYGDVDEPLDPDILDRANEVEVDPYQDVLGRDLTEEEIAAEDNPIDYDLEEDIDPYNAISDRDAEELSPEDIQAEDNPVDYVLEEEIDPYNAISDRDAEELSPEDIQAEDNPIDYNIEDEIDPYNAISDRDAEEGLTDDEIDAARADQQIGLGPDGLTTVSSAQAAQQQATLDRARAQATLQQQRKQSNDGDWRVKLRLAPGAQYLYRAAQPGILQPLAVTDGVVFPYTPSIQTAYKANYSSYDLTHSNYRGYFYQGSAVEDIQITGKFTAQDSNEANYLLAVIHFFRSITKMFYGLDSQRGAPPPLVFLQGLGEYQFNLAPCVVAQFNYTLPDSVDYIRAGSPNINGTNLLQRRNRQDLPTNTFSSAWSRIQNVLGAQGIRKGAIPAPPAPPTLGTNRPTYVPTAMEISITLHPIQSRSQVSKQFSLQQYANGDLLKGGFW